jgi:hypothetical protein
MNTSLNFSRFSGSTVANIATITGGKGGNGRAHPPTSQDIGLGNPGTSESATNEDNNSNNNNNNTNRPGKEGV